IERRIADVRARVALETKAIGGRERWAFAAVQEVVVDAVGQVRAERHASLVPGDGPPGGGRAADEAVDALAGLLLPCVPRRPGAVAHERRASPRYCAVV